MGSQRETSHRVTEAVRCVRFTVSSGHGSDDLPGYRRRQARRRDGNDREPGAVIDRAIPSYTPTIRALTHARRPRASASGGKNGEATGADDRIVVVAMPHTPGSSALPGVQEEAAEIQKTIPRPGHRPHRSASHP